MGTARDPSEMDQLVGRIGAVGQEAAAVVLGLGILGINRLQVVRRQVAARLSDLGSMPETDFDNDPDDT